MKNTGAKKQMGENTCLACGKPEHEWGPNCEGIIPKSSRPKPKTTKNNSTIAEILEEFDKKFTIKTGTKKVSRVGYYVTQDPDSHVGHDPKLVKAFIAQALHRQREELLDSLWMEKKHLSGQYKCGHEPNENGGYNIAVQENNDKITALRSSEGEI